MNVFGGALNVRGMLGPMFPCFRTRDGVGLDFMVDPDARFGLLWSPPAYLLNAAANDDR